MGLSSVQPANAATADSSETLTVDNATSNGVSAQEIAAADSIVIGDQEFDAVDRRETRQDVARSIETRTVAGEQPQVNPYGVSSWRSFNKEFQRMWHTILHTGLFSYSEFKLGQQ